MTAGEVEGWENGKLGRNDADDLGTGAQGRRGSTMHHHGTPNKAGTIHTPALSLQAQFCTK